MSLLHRVCGARIARDPDAEVYIAVPQLEWTAVRARPTFDGRGRVTGWKPDIRWIERHVAEIEDIIGVPVDPSTIRDEVPVRATLHGLWWLAAAALWLVKPVVSMFLTYQDMDMAVNLDGIPASPVMSYDEEGIPFVMWWVPCAAARISAVDDHVSDCRSAGAHRSGGPVTLDAPKQPSFGAPAATVEPEGGFTPLL